MLRARRFCRCKTRKDKLSISQNTTLPFPEDSSNLNLGAFQKNYPMTKIRPILWYDKSQFVLLNRAHGWWTHCLTIYMISLLGLSALSESLVQAYKTGKCQLLPEIPNQLSMDWKSSQPLECCLGNKWSKLFLQLVFRSIAAELKLNIRHQLC